jgi:FMN reductase
LTPIAHRDLRLRIGRQAAHRLGAEFDVVDIAELAPSLAITSFKNLPEAVLRAQQRLKAADLLVIGSPVYKGSYSGLLKHFLDLTDPNLLAGKVAVLAATGGSDRHALVIDHQLRPLASFFELNTVPAGVYARDTEFVDYRRLASESTQARVDLAVGQALSLLGRKAPVALAA